MAQEVETPACQTHRPDVIPGTCLTRLDRLRLSSPSSQGSTAILWSLWVLHARGAHNLCRRTTSTLKKLDVVACICNPSLPRVRWKVETGELLRRSQASYPGVHQWQKRETLLHQGGERDLILESWPWLPHTRAPMHAHTHAHTYTHAHVQ